MKLHGNGSIEQMEKGKSRGRCRRWRLWQSTDRGRKSRIIHGTYRQAQAALAAFREELAGKVPNSQLFADYAEEWSELRRDSRQFAPGTLANDKRCIRALLRTDLADMRMDAIDPPACRSALSQARDNPVRSDGPLSGTTMAKMHVTLHHIMQTAVDDGLIASNPMAHIRAPKPDTPERTWMDADALRAFCDAVEEREPTTWLMAVMLMAELGLRRSEACALEDSDVDTAAAIVRIRQAVKERDGSVGPPKSDAGKRVLPMTERLCRYVERWRAVRRERGLGDARMLCCNAQGGVLRPQNLERWWAKHKDELGAGGYTMHQLRHSNLSMMARFMTPFDLQKWAGWSSLAPARIYIHDDLASMKAAVARAQVRPDVRGNARIRAHDMHMDESRPEACSL